MAYIIQVNETGNQFLVIDEDTLLWPEPLVYDSFDTEEQAKIEVDSLHKGDKIIELFDIWGLTHAEKLDVSFNRIVKEILDHYQLIIDDV